MVLDSGGRGLFAARNSMKFSDVFCRSALPTYAKWVSTPISWRIICRTTSLSIRAYGWRTILWIKLYQAKTKICFFQDLDLRGPNLLLSNETSGVTKRGGGLRGLSQWACTAVYHCTWSPNTMWRSVWDCRWTPLKFYSTIHTTFKTVFGVKSGFLQMCFIIK